MKLFKSIANMISPEEEKNQMRDMGRNELCWCGSGKKYKKCHLVEDENKAKLKYGINCGKN